MHIQDSVQVYKTRLLLAHTNGKSFYLKITDVKPIILFCKHITYTCLYVNTKFFFVFLESVRFITPYEKGYVCSSSIIYIPILCLYVILKICAGRFFKCFIKNKTHQLHKVILCLLFADNYFTGTVTAYVNYYIRPII